MYMRDSLQSSGKKAEQLNHTKICNHKGRRKKKVGDIKDLYQSMPSIVGCIFHVTASETFAKSFPQAER